MSDDAFCLEGRCTCGAIAYRMTRRPMFVHCCHCTWCQRQTGTAFALNALIEAEHVQLLRPDQGEPELVSVDSPSGRGQTIARCPTCKVAVWSVYGRARELVRFVRVGTLDEPAKLPPDVHIYTSTKLPWVALPDQVPAFAEYYDLAQQWPAQSRARWDVIRERLAASSR